jgi:hypothetical protein
MRNCLTKAMELVAAGNLFWGQTCHGENPKPSRTENALKDIDHNILPRKSNTQHLLDLDTTQREDSFDSYPSVSLGPILQSLFLFVCSVGRVRALLRVRGLRDLQYVRNLVLSVVLVFGIGPAILRNCAHRRHIPHTPYPSTIRHSLSLIRCFIPITPLAIRQS